MGASRGITLDVVHYQSDTRNRRSAAFLSESYGNQICGWVDLTLTQRRARRRRRSRIGDAPALEPQGHDRVAVDVARRLRAQRQARDVGRRALATSGGPVELRGVFHNNSP
jgi:hypothetical protein